MKEDCEDVVQSVFLILWKSRAKMNDVLNIKQWLLRSTQNSCLNKLNHQTVVQRYSADYLLLMPYFSEDYSSNTLLYSDIVKLVASAEAYQNGHFTEYAAEIEQYYLPKYQDSDITDEELSDDDGRFDAWA